MWEVIDGPTGVARKTEMHDEPCAVNTIRTDKDSKLI